MSELDDSIGALPAGPIAPNRVEAESKRQRQAWEQFDHGWNKYAPLPQSADEAVLWQSFVPAVTDWRKDYTETMSTALATADATEWSAPPDARARLLATRTASFLQAENLLSELIELNYRTAEEATRLSLSSQDDLMRTRNFMLYAAGLSVLSIVGLALTATRHRRPVALEIAQAITAGSRGARDVHVNIPRDDDELAEIGTALNQMIGAVRDNEARLRMLSDNLPDSMVFQIVREVGKAQRFIHVSGGVEALHGVTAAEALRDSNVILSQILPDDRRILAAVGDESAKTMSAVDLIVRMRLREGPIRWRHLRSKPRQEFDGRLVWDGIETDITPRMVIEMEHKRLAHIVDAHDNAAIWFNSEHRIVYVNQATCKTTGYTREELLGQPVTLISPALSGQRLQSLWDELRKTGTVTDEGVRRRKDGTTFPIEFDVTYVIYNGEEYWCSFARNISERKLAERSLAEAAMQLSVALQASRLGVWRYDFAARSLECDERVRAIFGYARTASAPTMQELLALVVEEDRVATETAWKVLPQSNEPFRQRFRIRRPDGQLRHIELQGTVHRDTAEQPSAVVGAAGDITDTVDAITEAARLRSQLRQSQRLESLGKLAAGVAHDFNNLLTGINGFVELASLKLGPGHEAFELLKHAHQGALSARTLVRRILDFSRSGQEQAPVLLCLVETVRGTAPLLTAAMPPNVSLALAIECVKAPVLADSGQMQQILMNLCTNGAHAIGSNRGTVRIGVAHATFAADDVGHIPPGCAAGRYVRLTISDTGCGMDEATRQRIFEPFFTTKKQGKGTGLGLAIVHDIVHAHDGGLEVNSTPGAGTTFSIYIPLADSDRQAAALRSQS